MKKILYGGGFFVPAILLILICLNVYNANIISEWGAVAYADGSLFGHGSSDKVKSYVVQGVSGNVTAITTDNRILGYSVTGTVAAIVGIYDGKDFITEGGCLAGDMQTVWFPFPYDIAYELIVMVNASTTIVTIYYE